MHIYSCRFIAMWRKLKRCRDWYNNSIYIPDFYKDNKKRSCYVGRDKFPYWSKLRVGDRTMQRDTRKTIIAGFGMFSTVTLRIWFHPESQRACTRHRGIRAYRDGIRTEILLENGNPLSRGCRRSGLEINCAPYGGPDRRRFSSKEFFYETCRLPVINGTCARDKERVYC